MVDYYALLHVEKTAGTEEITTAIKKERRAWNQRANHPKQEVRQEAEQKVRDIAAAEATLLNATSRAGYDKELASYEAHKPDERPASTEGRNWLEVALEYLRADNFTSAAYAAREACEQQPNNPDAWYWRGVVSMRLDKDSDAEFELNEAIRLNPNDDAYYAELGDLFRFSRRFAQALKEYQKAIDLAPEKDYYKVSQCAALLGLDRATEALPIIEKVYKPGESKFATTIYAYVLHDAIISACSEGTITNENQLNYCKTQLAKLHTLQTDDADVRSAISRLDDMVRDAQTVAFRRCTTKKFYGIAILVAIIVNPTNPVFGLLGIAAVVAVYVWRHRMPGWKWNAKNLPEVIRSKGLQ